MSKVKAPLLSFGATGSLADQITYAKSGKLHIAKRIPTHIDANTQAQRDHRGKFIECIEHWRELSDEEKAAYESQARPYHLTGYQYYMSLNIMTVWCPPYTRYEYFSVDGNTWQMFYPGEWIGQQFKPQHTHTCYRVKLRLSRIGDPGNLDLCLAATDGSGHPTLPVLSEASFPDSTFVDDPTFNWYNLALPGANLSANTLYAWYIKAYGVDGSNYYHLAYETVSPTYDRGQPLWTGDEGEEWEAIEDADFPFEEWGCPGNA